MNTTKVDAYKCECGKTFVDKEIAERCCEIKMCECGKTTQKTYYAHCSGCLSKRAYKRWAETEKEASNSPMLYSDVLNKYFSDQDDLEYEYWEHMGKEDTDVTLKEIAQELRIYTCKEYNPDYFSVSETFENYLDTGDDWAEPPTGWEEVEKIMNDYLENSHGSWLYTNTNKGWNGE